MAIFCAGLFVFEWKGYGARIRDSHPLLSKMPKLLDIFYLPYQFKKSELPVYDLIISTKNLQKLNQSMPGDDFDMSSEGGEDVSADFIYNNQEYKVDIRYQGDLYNLWKYEKKSWRIEFPKSDLFEGKRKISLYTPEDRSFLLEHLSNYRAKKLGLIVPESRMVVLRINNQKAGVYYETESWSAEFLEKNKQVGESNFYGEYNPLAYSGYEHDLFESVAYWKKSVNETSDGLDNFADLGQLVDLMKNSSDKEFFQKIPNILDMDNFYRWQAHTVLMGSLHQDFVHNIRIYFDKTIGKFKFIPWDLRQGDWDEYTDLYYSELVTRLLKNPEFLHERNKILWDYVKNDKNLEDDFEFYNQTYQEVKTAFYKDRIKSFSNFYFDRKIKSGKEMMTKQYRNIQNMLKKDQTIAVARIFPQWVRIDLTTQGFCDLTLRQNSEMIFYYDENQNQIFDSSDLKFDNDFQMRSQRETPEEWFAPIKILPTNYSFFVKREQFDADNFQLHLTNAVTGFEIEPVVRFVDSQTFSYFDKINQSLEDFLKEYPIFKKNPSLNNSVVLYRGSYNINKNIIIPKDLSLRVEAGSELKFAPEVSLISYGRVEAIGNLNQPIIFSSQNKNKFWGVFGLVDSNTNNSKFEYCYFERGGQAYINGVFFSGMLAIHHADVQISHCRFSGASGDDSLNIKYSENSLVEKSEFIDNQFDAIDSDYSDLVIDNNRFINNGNDAIDISGSKPVIKNNFIKKSGDKCISLGEDTKAVIFNNILLVCDTGIAVKDLSEPLIANNLISGNKKGIDIYQKKQIFGGGFPKIYNTIIWDNQEQIVLDEKSAIEIFHSDIQGGYKGADNFEQKPVFQNPEQENYLLAESQENENLLKNGDSEILRLLIKKDIKVAPIGLFELFD